MPPPVPRYKSMSPARLPISRSPCFTIPPGLSPTSLLESPVLLTNSKAEPSPTTGTFSLHSNVTDTVGSNTRSSQGGTINSGSDDDFEFKPHIRSSSHPSLSTLGPLASLGPKQQEYEPCRRALSQSQTQTLGSSLLAEVDNIVQSSNEMTQSVSTLDPPVEIFSLETTAPCEVVCKELEQLKGPDNDLPTFQSDHDGSTLAVVEKSSEDGYNWRKYGQKHVKGCEFPRSYYKCTHPNCQMKKQLERSHDGQVTEIIYKGHHDHPKPQPSRRLAVGAILSSQGEERSDEHCALPNPEDKSSTAGVDLNGTPEFSPVSVSDEDVEVVGGHSNHIPDAAADDDDPESKRRKIDTTTIDATQIGKINREPRVVVQTMSEVDILDDGYRWRKYGQKVVKGNPNPRSYYKCTSPGCSVRKHVERASHDPKAVITTYEGKHNHDVPAARTTSSHDTPAQMMMINGGSGLDTNMPTALSGGMLRSPYDSIATSHDHYSQPMESSTTISLDLGVGISPNHTSIAAEEQQQAPGTEQIQNHKMQHFGGVRAAIIW